MPALGTGQALPRVEPGIKYSQGGPLYGQKLGGIAERQQLSEAAGEAASATAAAAAVGPGPLNSLINRTNRAREGFRRQTVLQSQVDAEKDKLALAREQEVRQWAQMALEGKFKGMEMARQQQALDAQISQNKQENAFRKEDIGLRREGQKFEQEIGSKKLELDTGRQALDEKQFASDQFNKMAEGGREGKKLALEERNVAAREKYWEAQANKPGKVDVSEELDYYLKNRDLDKSLSGIFYDPEGNITPVGEQAQRAIQGYKNRNPGASDAEVNEYLLKTFGTQEEDPGSEDPEHREENTSRFGFGNPSRA